MSELWDIYDENRKPTGKTILKSDFFDRNNCDYPDEYHIAVHIWIKNSEGKWLISKRTSNKNYPLLWECTGGSVVAGEDSLSGALREVKEELGIELDVSKGYLYKSIKREIYNDFCDVWLFECDCDINDVVLQEGETCDAMWASGDKILEMIQSREFIPIDNMEYVPDLLRE